MREWLIADVSFLDVHFRAWMLLLVHRGLGNAKCSLRFWHSKCEPSLPVSTPPRPV
jgi:hypothetical protein